MPLLENRGGWMTWRGLGKLVAIMLVCIGSLLQAGQPAAMEIRSEKVYEPVFGGQVLLVEAGAEEAETVVLVHGLGDAGSEREC